MFDAMLPMMTGLFYNPDVLAVMHAQLAEQLREKGFTRAEITVTGKDGKETTYLYDTAADAAKSLVAVAQSMIAASAQR